jgi:hypothetical protein
MMRVIGSDAVWSESLRAFVISWKGNVYAVKRDGWEKKIALLGFLREERPWLWARKTIGQIVSGKDGAVLILRDNELYNIEFEKTEEKKEDWDAVEDDGNGAAINGDDIDDDDLITVDNHIKENENRALAVYGTRSNSFKDGFDKYKGFWPYIPLLEYGSEEKGLVVNDKYIKYVGVTTLPFPTSEDVCEGCIVKKYGPEFNKVMLVPTGKKDEYVVCCELWRWGGN